MKKSNLIVIGIIALIVVLVVAITVYSYFNGKPKDNKITLDDLYKIEEKIHSEKGVKIKDFNKYEIKEKVEDKDVKIYVLDIDTKYEVEVREYGKKVVSVILKNKATFTSVDIMTYPLESYMKTENAVI